MWHLPAAQPLMTVNGRFPYRRGTAPDPERTWQAWESGSLGARRRLPQHVLVALRPVGRKFIHRRLQLSKPYVLPKNWIDELVGSLSFRYSLQYWPVSFLNKTRHQLVDKLDVQFFSNLT